MGFGFYIQCEKCYKMTIVDTATSSLVSEVPGLPDMYETLCAHCSNLIYFTVRAEDLLDSEADEDTPGPTPSEWMPIIPPYDS